MVGRFNAVITYDTWTENFGYHEEYMYVDYGLFIYPFACVILPTNTQSCTWPRHQFLAYFFTQIPISGGAKATYIF